MKHIGFELVKEFLLALSGTVFMLNEQTDGQILA